MKKMHYMGLMADQGFQNKMINQLHKRRSEQSIDEQRTTPSGISDMHPWTP